MGAAATTSRLLAEAAEAEFAERGIEGGSVRRIAAVAGQRNTNAVGYHFGSKGDLADSVYALRQPVIDGRRGELIHELSVEGPLDVRRALTAIFQPFCEVLDEPWGRTHLRFGRQYAHWLRTTGVDGRGEGEKRRAAAPNYVAAMAALERALDDVEPACRAWRLYQFEQLLLPTLGLLADDPASGPHSAVQLVDLHAAGLSAPTSERVR